MPDLDTMLRSYFDEIAPAVDVEREIGVRRATRRIPVFAWRRGLAVALAAALAVVLVVGAAALLIDRSAEPPVITAPPTPSTTLPVSDASDWGRTFFDETGHVSSVHWIDGRFVAVGSAMSADGEAEVGAVWMSEDGVDWRRSTQALGLYDEISDVAPGGPGVVAVGNNWGLKERPDAVVWTSVDGDQWTQVAHDEEVFGAGAASMNAVVSGGPGLVAVGGVCPDATQACPNQPTVWVSSDGLSWTRTVLDGTGTLRDVVSIGDRLVAVGLVGNESDQDAAVWTSSDGITWSRVPHSDAIFGGEGNEWMSALAVRGSVVVAVGTSMNEGVVVHGESETRGPVPTGVFWVSNDGEAWSRVLTLPSSSVEDVTVGGPGFVAVGSEFTEDGTAVVWTSPDGQVWTRVSDASSIYAEGAMGKVAASPERLVAFGSGELWASPPPGGWALAETVTTTLPPPSETTADAWTRRTHPLTLGEAWIPGTALFGERVVAVGGIGMSGNAGGIWLSDDSGETWQVSDMGPGAESARVEGVTVGGPGLIAVGSNLSAVDPGGAIWTSSDGEVWEMTTGGIFAGTSLQAVAAGPGRIVAVGYDMGSGIDAAIFTSDDGLGWSRVPHDDALFDDWVLRDVTWSGRDFVAVGNVSWQVENVPYEFAVWRSPDGLSWEPEIIDVGERHAAYHSSVAADANTAVAGLQFGGVWTSLDGGWELNTLQDLETDVDCPRLGVNDVGTFGSGFIAVGEGCAGRAGAWQFVDGQWSVISAPSDVFDGVMKSVQPIGAEQVLVFGSTRDGQAIVWTWTSGQ